ncbi:MAG: hypothetical protein Q7T74_05420 [Candidatus Saccharibacteria bacterium]|nr:hypothetical protein [Candidatus Saccharibacteria bacterium]
MGVVYSGAELEQGFVPNTDDHLRAARSALDLVSGLEDTQLTVVHGSVPEGRFNVRSDLDLLVTYRTVTPTNEPVVVREINSILDQISHDTHVKIEANIWPVEESVAARRERMYDLLFSRHLASSMLEPEWVIGEVDPTITEIARASYDTDILRRVILNYTTYKHAGFTKSPSTFSETDRVLSAFQRALELPKSLERKMGQFLGAPTHGIRETLVGLGMNNETLDAIETLRCLDCEYTGLLLPFQQNAGLPDKDEVTKYRDRLTAAYPLAIDNGLVASSGFSNFISTYQS